MAVVNVEGLSVVKENFSESSLDSSWQVVSGLGSYSLTNNPGYLRYYLKGPCAYSGGWMKDYKVDSWRPSLTLIRPFEGSNWILKTKVTYNIKACSGDINRSPTEGSTGAQYQHLYIVFGEGINDFIVIQRGTDWWYGVNIHEARFGGASCKLLSPDDIIKQEKDGGWARYTYWYEIVREEQKITFRYSYDGTNYTKGFSASLTKPAGATQKVVIDAGVWATAGSYVDWDYIYVEPYRIIHPLEKLSVISIRGVGKTNTKKLEAHGVKTIKDMSLVDVFTLGKKTGISLFRLYMWRRKATLVMDVKIDRALFSNILKMQLGDIITMPDEELGRKVNQLIEVISDLKKDISVLLISLDNAIVRSMTLEKLAT